MQVSTIFFLTVTSLAMTTVAKADITVLMHTVSVSGDTQSLGEIVIKNSAHGVVFTPALSGLTPGLHGFHVHENASCETANDEDSKQVAALAAGGHYDPQGSHQHGSPTSEGHLGDLPALSVDDRGHANTPVNATRLDMADLDMRALIIHVGGDNYSDKPAPLGGGGARFACGIILE